MTATSCLAEAGSTASSLVAALLSAALYFLIGRFFPQPAEHLQEWRIAALVACIFVYAAHFAYEHFSLRNAPRATALHVASGVAVGGFALAVAGMLHAGRGITTQWLIAMIVWPVVTAIPAFIGAWIAAALLQRRR